MLVWRCPRTARFGERLFGSDELLHPPGPLHPLEALPCAALARIFHNERHGWSKQILWRGRQAIFRRRICNVR